MRALSLYITFIWSTFFCLILQSSPTPNLEEQARSWLHTHLFMQDGSASISPYDIQITLNLIYFSWCRSTITLRAQKEAVYALDIIWKGWQNIAQTRLDPAIDLPYAILPEQQNSTLEHFWELAQRHRSIGMTYSYAVKMILDKQIVQNPLTLDGITDMRDNARHMVLQSLLDIRKQLGEFFHIKIYDGHEEDYLLQESILNPEQNLDEEKKGINLLEYIYTYIPQLALYSFIEANSMQNIVSEEGWYALKTIQEIGNQTWKAIEDARANFYHIYYTVLFNAIKQHGLPDSCLLLMFSPQGIIPSHEQRYRLPDPTVLDLPSPL